MISYEKPRPWRNRARFAFSSRVSAGCRYFRSRMARALPSSSSGPMPSMTSSEMPLLLRSWRILAEPNLRERERARSWAKRSSESCFLDASPSNTAPTASGDSACGASLRASSARECSRLARYLSARAFSSAGVSGPSFFNLRCCACGSAGARLSCLRRPLPQRQASPGPWCRPSRGSWLRSPSPSPRSP